MFEPIFFVTKMILEHFSLWFVKHLDAAIFSVYLRPILPHFLIKLIFKIIVVLLSSILKFIIMLMCLRPIFEYIFTKLVYSKCFSLLWYAFGLYTWPKIMFLHRAVLNYFRLYSPYISIFFSSSFLKRIK